jgi:ubiquinone/menaquinone biosynthesis C-methylase UbiE
VTHEKPVREEKLPDGALAPTLVDRDADRRFRALAGAMGLDADARYVGGYVDWEWRHSRHVFDGLVEPVAGRAVLELGCNVGATAIVLASLGARVTAVDPDPRFIKLACLNAERYGLSDRIAFVHVPDTRQMPFGTGEFDWVSCNSVLEYIPEEEIDDVLRSADRVLRRGGLIAILGTTNQLWPREGHSRRWLVHYVPRWLDPVGLRQSVRRGVTAFRIRAVLSDHVDVLQEDGSRLFLAMKARMGVPLWKLAMAEASRWPLARLGMSLGSFAPTLSMVLRKR